MAAIKVLCTIFLFTLLFFQCQLELSLCSRLKGLSEVVKNSKLQDESEFVVAAKKFLYHYGYLVGQLEPKDEELASAVTTFQLNFELERTGILDTATLVKMAAPRCGTPDIVDGINMMNHTATYRTAAGIDNMGSSLYEFFIPDKKLKWDTELDGVVILRYRFAKSFPPQFKDAIDKAFEIWEKEKTPFLFYGIGDNYEGPEHISIGFFSGDHGDREPFDGPGEIVAHATGPRSGAYIHFDADEAWIDGASPNMIDIVTVAVHEIGHVLGLGHTKVYDAIMYPYFLPNVMKRTLHPDDLAGISALYDNDYYV